MELLSVGDLLRRRRPFTGAASFPSSPLPTKKRKALHLSPPPIAPPGPTSPNAKLLSPLPRPALLIGTVRVPDPDEDNAPACWNAGSCLLFSDGSGRVCCSVLDFDARIVGRRIRVLACNYVPMEAGCGVLEIIRWEFVESLTREDDDLGEPPLLASSSSSSHHSRICGTLASISPMFDVPCTIESRSLQNSCLGDGSRKGGNLKGFLAEIVVRECLLCDASCESLERVARGGSMTSSVVVYLCGSASPWRPVFMYLIGRRISIKGVKKKLVSLEVGGCYEMFVTVGGTSVYKCKLVDVLGPIGRNMVMGEHNIKSYAGVVTGCFMQGIVFELDNNVWVVLPDRLHAISHSVRVGALIILSHVHFVRAKYSWEKVILLGVCSNTNISIKSFSYLETRSHFVSQKRSYLGSFVDSLSFSCKFWVVLLILCFRKKFHKTFTDKQILGSKHHRGLIETYARLRLPARAFYARHSVMTDFCNRRCCNYVCERISEPLKLVAPISYFIQHCESKWTPGFVNMQSCYISDGRSSCGKYIRRVIPSEEIGVALLGYLQFSMTSKRLQLQDATGTLDVVVPDLLSDGYLSKLYEVKDYKLIIEGVHPQKKPFGVSTERMLSCRHIFSLIQSQKEDNDVEVYVHFSLKTALCLHVPFGLSCIKPEGKIKLTRGVNYYIMSVAHKHPVLMNVHGDSKTTEKSSLFAEVFFFPYALFVPNNDETQNLLDVSKNNGRAQFACVDWNRCSEEISVMSSACIDKTDMPNGFSVFQKNHLNVQAKLTFPCKLMVKGYNSEECIPAKLLAAEIEQNSRKKILLELSSFTGAQYGVLRIGSFYVMELSREEAQFASNKILVTSERPLWSLCISMSDSCQSKQEDTLLSGYSSDTSDEALLFTLNDSEGSSKNIPSDLHLYLPLELESSLEKFKASLYPQNHFEVTAPLISFGVTLKWPLFEGNLVSIRGNIMDVHSVCTVYKGCVMKSISEICIHVQGENYTVKVRGTMGVRPVGMAPGANATFHRVLYTGSSGGCELMLTPVSLVIVNFVREVSMDSERCSLLCTYKLNIPNKYFSGDLPLCTVSQLFEQCGKRNVRLCCRVSTVIILLLEYQEQKLSAQFSYDLSIPLAGFVLDDGSSLCCCWAEEECAADLLCLNQNAPKMCRSNYWTSSLHEDEKYRKTVGYCLQKILKKHEKISIKKCVSLCDPLSLKLKFSTGSGKNLSPKEKSLLKILVLSSCCGQLLTVAGDLIDSGNIKHFRKKIEIDDTMQNIWAREVSYINHVDEARGLMRELTAQ